jgi:transposase-like protein
LKFLYLALGNIAKYWTKPVTDWQAVLNRFAFNHENRPPLAR